MPVRNHSARLGAAAFAVGVSLTCGGGAVAGADTGATNPGSADGGASTPAPGGTAPLTAPGGTAPLTAPEQRGGRPTVGLPTVGHSKPTGSGRSLRDRSVAATPAEPLATSNSQPQIADSTSTAEGETTSSPPRAVVIRESRSPVERAIATVAPAATVTSVVNDPPVTLAAAATPKPVVPTAAVGSNTVPPDLLSAVSDWIGGWPASPLKSFLEGIALMARRYLFNRDPITNPVQTVTLSNGQIFGTVGAFDAEGDAITYVLAQAPQHGTVSLDEFGGYTYTPGGGYTGTDSFAVKVDDSGSHMNLGNLFRTGTTATISVIPNAALPSGSIVDNFDGAAGTSPDPSVWATVPGHDDGLQVYTESPDNLRLDGDGHLIIAAQQTEDGYTSARIASQDLMHIQYGTVVGRIKMPAGQGFWPSFWMLGADYGEVGWPQSGEIDIMELVNTGSMYHVTLHGPQVWDNGAVTDYYGGGEASGKVVGVQGPIDDLSTDYHDYWMKWRENNIVIGVDDQTLAVFTPDDLPDGAQWKFNQPMFVVMQVSVGGTWPGPPDETTPWPATMLVDSFQYTPYV